jgi:hypothetical protein
MVTSTDSPSPDRPDTPALQGGEERTAGKAARVTGLGGTRQNACQKGCGSEGPGDGGPTPREPPSGTERASRPPRSVVALSHSTRKQETILVSPRDSASSTT